MHVLTELVFLSNLRCQQNKVESLPPQVSPCQSFPHVGTARCISLLGSVLGPYPTTNLADPGFSSLGLMRLRYDFPR